MSLCSALDACFVAGVRALRAGCRRAEDASSIAPVICGPLFFRIGVCWLFVYTQVLIRNPQNSIDNCFLGPYSKMLSLQCVSNRVWAECQTGTAPTCLRWPFLTPSASHSQVCAALPLRICAERLLWVNPSVGQNPSHPPLYVVTSRFRHPINTLYLSPKLQYYKPQSVVTDM